MLIYRLSHLLGSLLAHSESHGRGSVSGSRASKESESSELHDDVLKLNLRVTEIVGSTLVPSLETAVVRLLPSFLRASG